MRSSKFFSTNAKLEEAPRRPNHSFKRTRLRRSA